ncbi:hypothetical protein SAY87_002816 [Trapa incisa]|uniref:Zinc finger CCCH domain-containing protein 41 n=1 Tax=Trapa incisa TaxID=236973 RepID=A0AAN7PV06_9MYRT|nr:hypothetical protein SAY87_002816 [Trapa incisa]
MVLKISSPRSGNLSASDYASDPEKEISDDDDDDRNHKHRRRETRSHSSDKNVTENISTRPYRNENRSFENGHAFRESKLQSGQYNLASSEKQFPGKFGKRPFDLNQRNRINQTYPGDLSLGRGRGRDTAWNHHNSRFTAHDIASQVIPQRSIPPGLFPERGMPSIPNVQAAAWGGYGLISGIPNGTPETLHPIGLQGAFRPAMSSSLGIPRQRCRDFEERGFCLRGDMCPMEHGINRIVVEDVQSLSQFNLPVSLSSGSILGVPAVPGSLPSLGATSSTMINNNGPHGRNGKHGMADDSFASKSAYTETANVAATDLYDPDQPLWNNDGPETSSSLVGIRPSAGDEVGTLSNDDAFDNQMNGVADAEKQNRTSLPVGSQSTSSSIWGRIGHCKGRTSITSASDSGQNEIAGDQAAVGVTPGSSNRGKKFIAEDADPKALDSSRVQSDAMRLLRKPTQKALRTLFVNGIPQKNNRRDALLSHFQKFGKIVDIYIPANSERAFVQFSKREEAETALKAPDAVMGNRFIKLWWANRDNISDAGISGVAGVSSSTPSRILPTPLSIPSRGKDNVQPAAKANNVLAHDALVTHPDLSKLSTASSPKVTPSQKKLELEQLKEQLRKKQEMLDQKRIDFKRQLDKLSKQATGVKCEDAAEQVTKRQKAGSASDPIKAIPPQPSDSAAPTPRSYVAGGAETLQEENADNKIKENDVSHMPYANLSMGPQESIKQQPRPLAPPAMQFTPIKYKLDNRPTAFRILPPLPSDLANASALKEHFSSYGDPTVVLEDEETCDSPKGPRPTKRLSARVGFKDRQAAERAFLNCKSWQGHNLQFAWVSSAGHVKPDTTNARSTDNPSAAHGRSESDAQSAEKVAPASSHELVNGNPVNSVRERPPAVHANHSEVPQSLPSSVPDGKVD